MGWEQSTSYNDSKGKLPRPDKLSSMMPSESEEMLIIVWISVKTRVLMRKKEEDFWPAVEITDGHRSKEKEQYRRTCCITVSDQERPTGLCYGLKSASCFAENCYGNGKN